MTELIGHEDFNYHWNVIKHYPCLISAMNNIPLVPLEEWSLCPRLESFEQKMMLRPLRKFMERMMDLIPKLCKAEKLILDICADNLVTANVFLLLSELCKFFICEKVSVHFQESFTSLVDVYRKQVSGSASDIVRTDEVREARKISRSTYQYLSDGEGSIAQLC